MAAARWLKNKGFTLAESLMALAILAFALCGILGTYARCLVLITTAHSMNAATTAAQGLIEEIRGTAFAQIVTDYDGLNFTVNEIPASAGTVTVDASNPELLQATVSVSWTQGTNNIGPITFVTLIANR